MISFPKLEMLTTPLAQLIWLSHYSLLVIILTFFLVACNNPLGSQSESHISSHFGPVYEKRTPMTMNFEGPILTSYSGETQSKKHRVDITIGPRLSQLRVKTTNGKDALLNFQGQEKSK